MKRNLGATMRQFTQGPGSDVTKKDLAEKGKRRGITQQSKAITRHRGFKSKGGRFLKSPQRG